MARQPFIQLIRPLKTGVIRPVLLTSPVTMSLFDQTVSRAMMMTSIAVDGRDGARGLAGQPLATSVGPTKRSAMTSRSRDKSG